MSKGIPMCMEKRLVAAYINLLIMICCQSETHDWTEIWRHQNGGLICINLSKLYIILNSYTVKPVSNDIDSDRPWMSFKTGCQWRQVWIFEIKIHTCLHLISFISTIIMRYIVIHVTVFYSNHIHVIIKWIKAIYTI